MPQTPSFFIPRWLSLYNPFVGQRLSLRSEAASATLPVRRSQVMDFTAECFDAPLDSDEHAGLRDSAWMGGDLVEGRYLLGMLIGENLFRVSNEEYARKLHDFVSTRVSASVADIFCGLADCQHLTPYLRHHYTRQSDFTSMPTRNDRIEVAVAHLLHNLNASDAEIAAVLGTSEKQVQRISDLTALRKAIRLYRESASK